MSDVDFMAEIRAEIYLKGMQMNKPHKHAEVLMAAINGQDIQSRTKDSEPWETLPGHQALSRLSWQEHHQYRIKPEPMYPETQMTVEELDKVYTANHKTGWPEAFKAMANAAIRRAIQDGDVVLPGEKE